MGDPRLVRDDQQRHPFPVELPEQVDHSFAGARVEVPGGLVGQEQRWPRHQRPGDGDALPLAPGKRGWPRARLVGEADPVERLPRSALRVGNAVAEEVGQENVLQRGEGGEQVEALEDEPDLRVPQGGKLRVGDGAQIAAEHQRFARELAIQAAQDVQQRALSAAALALDRKELAAAHREVDAAEQILWKRSGLARRVLLGDATQLDGAHGATSSTSRLPPNRSGSASAARFRRTVRRGSITCPTSERATYDCGPVPYALWGSSRRAAASWPKSTRSAAPALP